MKMNRKADHPIDTIFLNRWSPRAFDASIMPKTDLLSILEAARWAPSAFNVQPWRFLYSHRDDVHWNTYLTLLDSFNATWADKASALIFVLSDTIMPGEDNRAPKPSRFNSFDTGAAWAQLALQTTSLGYHAHAMAGIHFDQVRKSLFIPDQYRIEIAIAVGRQADPTVLSDNLRSREIPSHRLSVDEIAYTGGFPQ